MQTFPSALVLFLVGVWHERVQWEREDLRRAVGTKLTLIGKTDAQLGTLTDDILTNRSLYNGQAYSFALAMKNGKFSSKSNDNILNGLHNVTKNLAQKYPNIELSNISIEVQSGNFNLLPNIKF